MARKRWMCSVKIIGLTGANDWKGDGEGRWYDDSGIFCHGRLRYSGTMSIECILGGMRAERKKA